MGSLKPGTKYIYEHSDGITYAREFGAPHDERFEIGRTAEKQAFIDELRDRQLWSKIHKAAKNNSVLQEAIDRVIMLYHLSERNGEK